MDFCFNAAYCMRGLLCSCIERYLAYLHVLHHHCRISRKALLAHGHANLLQKRTVNSV